VQPALDDCGNLGVVGQNHAALDLFGQPALGLVLLPHIQDPLPDNLVPFQPDVQDQ
jgi:hypothetical protein